MTETKTLKEKLLEERKDVIDLLSVRVKNFIDTKEEWFLERMRCGCTEDKWIINTVVNPPKTSRELRMNPSDEILDEVADRLTAELGFKVGLFNVSGDVWMELNWSSKEMR